MKLDELRDKLRATPAPTSVARLCISCDKELDVDEPTTHVLCKSCFADRLAEVGTCSRCGESFEIEVGVCETICLVCELGPL